MIKVSGHCQTIDTGPGTTFIVDFSYVSLQQKSKQIRNSKDLLCKWLPQRKYQSLFFNFPWEIMAIMRP